MNNKEQILQNYDEMIRLELQSVNLQKQLIAANEKGTFTLNKIIMKEARASIEQSKEAVQTFVFLKKKIALEQSFNF